jgi:hypothetical protein
MWLPGMGTRSIPFFPPNYYWAHPGELIDMRALNQHQAAILDAAREIGGAAAEATSGRNLLAADAAAGSDTTSRYPPSESPRPTMAISAPRSPKRN